MTKKGLIQQVNKLARNANESDTIQMLYDGDVIGEYQCYGMYEPDCKTPSEWVRGNLVFCIELKGRDINKVSLQMKK